MFAFKVILYSTVMFLLTFSIGLLPAYCVKEKKAMNLISIYGAGLLVGAAIIIIVPEAIKVILNSYGDSSHQSNFMVGITLLAGFSVMLIFDEVFKIFTAKKIDPGQEPLLNPSHHQHHHAHVHHHEARSVPITSMALIVQACCDGVALGVSLYLQKTGTSDRLGLLLFSAICLQKAPTAIGYGTFLQHAGFDLDQVIQQMLRFTLACPVLCLLTYIVLNSIKQTDISYLHYLTGVFLLFSAGAFVYVATIHILPEVYCQEVSEQHGRHDHEDIDRAHTSEEHGSKACELLTLLLGLYTPLLIELAV